MDSLAKRNSTFGQTSFVSPSSRRFFANILFAIFLILPVLDSINGYFVRAGRTSIGPVYHVAIGAVCFLIAWRYRESRYKLLPILHVGLCIALSLLCNKLFSPTYYIFPSMLAKFYLTFVYVCCFMVILRHDRELSTRVLSMSAFVIPTMIIVLRILGIGNASYASGESGFIGFYTSSNELNVILVVLGIYCLMRYAAKPVFFFYCIVANLLCMVMVESKAGLALAVVFAAWFIVDLFKTHKRSRLSIFVLLVTSVAVVALVFGNTIAATVQSFIARQSFLMDALTERGILSYVTSGRVDRFDILIFSPMAELFDSNPLLHFTRLIFGNGFAHYEYLGFESEIHFEMDFFDSFYWLGLVGAWIYILFFWKTRKQMYKTQSGKSAKVAFWIILATSFFIGHIMYGGVVNVYFGFLIATLRTVDLKPAKRMVKR